MTHRGHTGDHFGACSGLSLISHCPPPGWSYVSPVAPPSWEIWCRTRPGSWGCRKMSLVRWQVLFYLQLFATLNLKCLFLPIQKCRERAICKRTYVFFWPLIQWFLSCCLFAFRHSMNYGEVMASLDPNHFIPCENILFDVIGSYHARPFRCMLVQNVPYHSCWSHLRPCHFKRCFTLLFQVDSSSAGCWFIRPMFRNALDRFIASIHPIPSLILASDWWLAPTITSQDPKTMRLLIGNFSSNLRFGVVWRVVF